MTEMESQSLTCQTSGERAPESARTHPGGAPGRRRTCVGTGLASSPAGAVDRSWYARAVKKLVVGGLLVGVAVAAAIWGFRRVPAGGAAWDRRGGDLLVAAERRWLPSWQWRPVAGGTAGGEVAAATRDGVRLNLHVSVAFPPGRHHLGAGADPDAALTAAAARPLRDSVATIAAGCLAGIAAAGCPASAETQAAAAVAAALGLAADQVKVEVEADPAALAAAGRRALRELAGAARRRVLVVGWDGADWEVLEPLVKKGAMPNLVVRPWRRSGGMPSRWGCRCRRCSRLAKRSHSRRSLR